MIRFRGNDPDVLSRGSIKFRFGRRRVESTGNQSVVEGGVEAIKVVCDVQYSIIIRRSVRFYSLFLWLSRTELARDGGTLGEGRNVSFSA